MANNNLVVGLVAHVDSGKTTLAEGILYTCGKKRILGRVDHKDTLLDDFAIERERGITVFAKQAVVAHNQVNITLLDTPGHVDFSAEMERTLQVLDAAVLLIGANDKVQGHTLTLWKLLNTYKIPTIVFVNKMDMEGIDKSAILESVHAKLSDNIVDFSAFAGNGDKDILYDSLSMCNESMMEEFLEHSQIDNEHIIEAFLKREMFPLLFGSALQLGGISELLDVLVSLIPEKVYDNSFSARVYKISRDDEGQRLTHVKITGGSLQVKDKIGEEKVNQIRIYNGSNYDSVNAAEAGQIVALTGLETFNTGDGIGNVNDTNKPLLVPVLSYKVISDEREDDAVCLKHLKELAEEIPELNVNWNETLKEIHISVMGDVQNEIVQRLYNDRYGLNISFGEGSILYKETIAGSVEGIGHYEPLRHYSEVHLLLEPGIPGSGITIAADVSVDELELNWQRLIMTHLEEKEYKGVLTGSPITDIKITVIGGRAHNKHTEGGDFRQSTYRAVRQGLMSADNILLEPYISFTLRLPTEHVGRAMTDIKKNEGNFEAPVLEGDESIITGIAPVSTMFNYGRELSSYSRGRGQYSYEIMGYKPCHNAEEVIAKSNYIADEDLENPSSSVFCAHGAGYLVPWYEVPKYAHVDCSEAVARLTGMEVKEYDEDISLKPITGKSAYRQSEMTISLEEIEQIYSQTYKQSKEELSLGRYIGKENKKKVEAPKEKEYVYKPASPKEKYLLVDGYNIIFAWEDLNELAKENIDSARDALIDICCNYQGSTGINLILVYDAYKVKGNPGSIYNHNGIYVVYTREAETADQYIEKTVRTIAKNRDIIVATNDLLEQTIIFGEGARRMPAREFAAEIERENKRLISEGFIKV